MIDFLASLEPQYLIVGFTVLGGLLALPLLFWSIRRFSDLRFASGSVLMLFSALLVSLGVAAALLAASLRTYHRLTAEQEAARVAMRQVAPKHYALSVQPKDAKAQTFEVLGDEWQIDARLLKWRPIATIAGFDTVYRLERVSGRYSDLAEEQKARRTVYGLAERAPVDFWVFLRQYNDWLPFGDALYGSAAFVPMADGAEYAVTVSSTGLVVRPTNDAARKAVGAWK
jgi:hypothetical protein